MTDGFSTELQRHLPRMYRVALRVVGQPEVANDVVQEACVKALRSESCFDHMAATTTWLHQITLNCARDHIRKVRRSPQEIPGADYDLTETVAAMEMSPLARVELLELYRKASGYVNALPGDCRAAFILTQLDGYSYDEAAAIEGQPRGTIASRVNRAKKILLERMSDLTDRTSS